MATYQNETNYYITYSRYNRAFTHRLFLVSTNIYDDKIAFDVMGTTGNVYNLNIKNKKIICDCPDYKKNKNTCKHIFYILCKVFKKTYKEVIENKYSKKDLEKKLETLSIGKNYANIKLLEKYEKLKENGKKEVNQKEISEDCPICFDKLDNIFEITYCKYGCGKSFHVECINKWLLKNNSCVYCREEINKNKYINLLSK